ncbi:MAG: RNA-directed DNA polymerase, partial [Dysgonamonadaceae bacterium]|nr:RNA-directed DNA polymerase [Dysgonamonadaceae bacterium]
QLIDDCYSCQKGRGTHYGIQRMEGFLRECSENYTRDCYVLKLDVRGYFMSIDKQLLWKKLERILEPLQLFNPRQADLSLLWWMFDRVVWNDPTKSCIINGKLSDWEGLPDSKSLFKTPPNCGLPIGNLTSQLFSNVYMYDFDCFVKNVMGITYYGRYVDDFVLMHQGLSAALPEGVCLSRRLHFAAPDVYWPAGKKEVQSGHLRIQRGIERGSFRPEESPASGIVHQLLSGHHAALPDAPAAAVAAQSPAPAETAEAWLYPGGAADDGVCGAVEQVQLSEILNAHPFPSRMRYKFGRI